MTSILVHACCAPCATASVAKLAEDGEAPYLYFFNPNIHPYQEFSSRLESFGQFLQLTQLPGEIDDGYGLKRFMQGIQTMDKPGRCASCYMLRMDAAARRAKELGIAKFTTTLTISPYQVHELIKIAGREASRKHGVEFEYHDFRPLYRRSRQMAKDAGFYMQKYCGCVFSEAERFMPEPRGAGK